jgi:hypothetical protein
MNNEILFLVIMLYVAVIIALRLLQQNDRVRKSRK